MVYDYRKIEQEVQDHWKKNKIPEQLSKFNPKTKKKFYVLDGPPYANGVPHAGHFMTIAYKDVWGKFKKMQGYDVWFQPGFDCHGLPIENKIEGQIGVKSKDDINKYGVEKFIEACKAFSAKNMNIWMDLYRKVGAWKGWVSPYFTYDNNYVESGWWTFKKMYENGLLVQGTKPIHWCSSCETALAGYEVTDEYRDLEDPGIYIKFKLSGKSGEYLLAFTTTPWTLPSNAALLVHPDETYVTVEVGKEKLTLAKKLLGQVMKKTKSQYKILNEFPGKKLEGLKYDPLLDVPVQKLNENAHRVYVSVPIMKNSVSSKVAEKKGIESSQEFGHLVTMDTGTGIVHIAPGHGSEDNKIGEHYKIPAPSPIDDRGRLMEGTGFEGIFVKDADPKIIQRLKNENKLFHYEKIKHSYPVCWRCKTPLIFRLSKQWFVAIDMTKKKMLKANSEINWMPDFAKTRMHNWIEDAPDWCISRQRYWGIPLPIWACSSCNSIEVMGSRKELGKKMSNGIKLTDLHKHVVDKVKLKCKCKGEMSRVPDIADVWFDSGIAPWASLGYPENDKGLYEKLGSADIVNESQDQIRGWFYHLIFASVAAFGKKSIEAIGLNGWVVDEKGEKMSKSKGNGIDAEQIYNELGADVGRLYYFTQSAPWDNMKFSLKWGKELDRYMIILLNLENFIDMYNIDLSKKYKITLTENKWILSKTNSLVKNVTEDLENFRFHTAGKRLTDFLLNDFSRLYMKLVKDKIETDKTEISGVMRTVLSSYLRLLAPICPFITEKVYLKLIGEKKSVHMESWPEVGEIDPVLEADFELLDNLVESINSIRQDKSVGLRYPVKSVTISGPSALKKHVKQLSEIIQNMGNVKEVLFGEEVAEIEVKPNFASLGKKFGKDVPKIAPKIDKSVAGKILENGEARIGSFTLMKDDVIITEKSSGDGRTFRSSYGVGIVEMNTTETQDIVDESLIRELIRKVQEMRKERDMKIADKIELVLDAKHEDVVKKWKDEIMKGTGSSSLKTGKADQGKAEYKGRVISFSF